MVSGWIVVGWFAPVKRQQVDDIAFLACQYHEYRKHAWIHVGYWDELVRAIVLRHLCFSPIHSRSPVGKLGKTYADLIWPVAPNNRLFPDRCIAVEGSIAAIKLAAEAGILC